MDLSRRTRAERNGGTNAPDGGHPEGCERECVEWPDSGTGVVEHGGGGGLERRPGDGRGAGTAAITATSEGVSGYALVTVPPPVASISVSPANVTLIEVTVQQLVAVPPRGRHAAAGRTMIWNSSDPTKATVSSAGLVTALAEGSVTITPRREQIEGSAAVTVLPLPAKPW